MNFILQRNVTFYENGKWKFPTSRFFVLIILHLRQQRMTALAGMHIRAVMIILMITMTKDVKVTVIYIYIYIYPLIAKLDEVLRSVAFSESSRWNVSTHNLNKKLISNHQWFYQLPAYMICCWYYFLNTQLLPLMLIWVILIREIRCCCLFLLFLLLLHCLQQL